MNRWVKALVQNAIVRDEAFLADSDLLAAGMVLDAIAQDRVVLCIQPIVSSLDREQILYQECLVRILGEDGSTLEYPSAFIPSLERLGLMRFLDRYVMCMVVEYLESDRNLRLGVNISAESTRFECWWDSIFELLGRKPDIATRLVVEITETTRLPVPAGREFVERLQRMGCLIAVDDYGDGFSVENGSRICDPDIIKIAGCMLPTDAPNGERFENLANLVATAGASAKCVVVEGIESSSALLAAWAADVLWVQGFHTGKPTRLSKKEPVSDAPIERAMVHFEHVANALVDRCFDVEMRRYAKLAYASGLAGIVYGRSSVVATGFRGGLAAALRPMACGQVSSLPILRFFSMLGRANGQRVACRAGYRVESGCIGRVSQA